MPLLTDPQFWLLEKIFKNTSSRIRNCFLFSFKNVCCYLVLKPMRLICLYRIIYALVHWTCFKTLEYPFHLTEVHSYFDDSLEKWLIKMATNTGIRISTNIPVGELPIISFKIFFISYTSTFISCFKIFFSYLENGLHTHCKFPIQLYSNSNDESGNCN